MNARINYCVLIVILMLILIPGISSAQIKHIDIIRERMIENALKEKGFLSRIHRYTTCDFPNADKYQMDLAPSGSWKDIDYSDTDNKWDPLRALDRILVMTFAFRDSTNELHMQALLLQKIEQAIHYWYEVNPTCKNWYKNEIAKQMYLAVIALLLQDHINQDLLGLMVADLTESPRMTGSNRTLLSVAVFYRGVLEKNSNRITLGLQGVLEQVSLGDAEGIQYDYSFHQHGAFIYNGSYGHNFLRETLWVASMVRDSPFAFTEEHIAILRNYYLDGTRWMIWRDLLDFNVRGRQVGRSHSFGRDADAQIPLLNQLSQIDPAFANQYEISKQQIILKNPQDIEGHKHFWHSDYSVHYTPKYFTSLRMCSKRTVGMEMNVNGENLLGFYLPFGLTYIYRRGAEYQDIFPVWDWGRLPGVTSPHHTIDTSRKSGQNTTFVGGLSAQKAGISVMDLAVNQTTALKSWFWFPDEWVALGSDVNSESLHEIVTGINQTRLNSPVLIDGNILTTKEQTLENITWVWHDSVGYIFPKQQVVSISAKEQKGQLKDIYQLGQDSIYRMNVFSLWYSHGVQPQDASYVYCVKPACSPEDLEDWIDNDPIKIIVNNKHIQAVSHHQLGMTGIVFHQAGGIALSDSLTLEVSRPCLLIYDEQTKEISISDPTMELKEVSVTKKVKDNIEPVTKVIAFPKKPNVRGTSVVFTFQM